MKRIITGYSDPLDHHINTIATIAIFPKMKKVLHIKQKAIYILIFILMTSCFFSCRKNEGVGSISKENISPVSLLLKKEGEVISLGSSRSDIEAVLGSPNGEPNTHGDLIVLQYGDVMGDDLIHIGFIDDKASLFILNLFSGKRFYTDLGLTIGTPNVNFWKMYDIPDYMSHKDKMDVRDSCAFRIVEENDAYNLSIVGDDEEIGRDISESLFYMYVSIDYKNFSCDVNGISIVTSEALQLYYPHEMAR